MGFAACATAGATQIRVATLTTVLTEVAREVGGDTTVVVGLVGAGVDPHTFNPAPSDIRTLVDADLVLASGLDLEPYIDRLVASAGLRGRVVAVGDALPRPISAPGPGGRIERDPHWWHSVRDVILATDRVRAEFTRERPEYGEQFAARANAYEKRLHALDVWVSLQVNALPPAARHLVTSHDAFGYFARDYGFAVDSIGGLSTDGEADARRVASLVELIRSQRIRAVFTESTSNPRLVENLVLETGVRLGDVLYSDGLGPAGSGAATYDAMYRHNVRAIILALSAP